MASIPTWFDANFYMASKLAQMQATDPEGNWTAETLKAAFAENGFTGTEGIYAHYDKYSLAEETSPSQYLDADYYLAAKLEQMKKTDPSYTMDQLLAAFKESGLTVGEHYDLYGSDEGINPSAAFDQAKYMADKLAQLQKTEPDAEWTAAKVQEAFDDAGLTPLEHYLLYGKSEGLTPRPVVETFAFTPEVDTLVGTDGNDTFSGVIGYLPGETTINKYDSVDGGAGTDTVVVNATSDVKDLQNITAKSIEQLTINATYASVNDKVDSWADLEGITISGATGVTLTAGDKVKSLTLDGVDGAVSFTANNLASVSLSDMASASVTLTAASAASMNVNLDDVKGTLDLGASVKTVILNSAGGEEVANALSLDATAATTLVITGDTDMAVSMDGTALSTINAQSFTGDLDLNNVAVSTSTNILTGSGDDDIKLVDAFAGKVFAGAGDDTVTLGTSVAANAVIDGGAGYDEIVTGVTGISTVDKSADATALFGAAATITNFEALTIADGSQVAKVDFTGLAYDTVNVMAASADMTVTFSDGNDTLGLAGSMDTLTITGADASIDFIGKMDVTAAVSATATTKLDLDLAADAAVSIKSLDVKDGATITVTDTGVEKAGSLEITAVSGVTTKGVTIDGSAVATATLDITGSDKADTIKGGAGDDHLAGGKGADMLYGGAGANTFKVAAEGMDSVAKVIAAADSIMDWAAGAGNKIEDTAAAAGEKAYEGFSVNAKGVVTFGNSSLTLDQMVNMLNDGLANDTSVLFTHGSDSYVFSNAENMNSDILVKIAGVTDITDLSDILA
ncbi:MAG: hypothetical protein ACLU6O_00635 [Bilophila wadsworthia]